METDIAAGEHARASPSTSEDVLGLTGFVLLPLRAADGGGELGVPGQVPLSPVVGVAAVPDAFAAAGSGQGQGRTLGGQRQKAGVTTNAAAPQRGGGRPVGPRRWCSCWACRTRAGPSAAP